MSDLPEPINPRVIGELRALGSGSNPRFLSEIIELFLKETTQRVAQLRKSLETRDAIGAERISHTMKGSCGNIGAARMSAMCDQLRTPLRQALWAEAEKVLAEIELEYGRVAEALEAEKQR
jgi:HPt (histidine-containing phosphotransfer) domain-containing protein